MSSSTSMPARALTRAVRAFLSTESSSTLVLLAATVVALVWANSPFAGTYDAFWHTPLTVELGELRLSLDLQHWVNDGLMALFFFVIGMEVSREFTIGELRDRRMVMVPTLAALGGVVVPALVYLAFNAGGPGAVGWGVPIATDTAFVLGVLTLVGPRCPDALRVFLLTLAVVDDVVAILIVAVAYTSKLEVSMLAAAGALFALVLVLRLLGVGRAPVYVLLAAVIWLFTVESGLHPTVVGLALGVLVQAYNPPDRRLVRAGELVEEFTREPTPQRGRDAELAVQAAMSPNERLESLLHPWTSYLIVPVFAVANAGIPLDPASLARAVTSPITLGVVTGLVIGKFAGVCLGAWAALRSRTGMLVGNLVWGQLAGGAALAGIGFTVSLFIAELAFADPVVQDEAKIGILGGSLVAAALGRTIFWLAWDKGAVCAPPGLQDEPMPRELPDVLAEAVSERDHVRGNEDAAVTLVEYGDYECPYCGRMYPVVEALRQRFGERLRFVFRHFPLDSVHPLARGAALASEAAGAHGKFWEMHDRLFTHQNQLHEEHLGKHAEKIGLPADAAVGESAQAHAERVQADVESGHASGVRGTPTFFVNGRRYEGEHDLASLGNAIEDADR